jgi:epimerase transport system membrane fusion protein
MQQQTNTKLKNELNPVPYIKFGTFVLLLMFLVFFAWGAYAPLKSVVVVSGKIIASGQNKVVQHLYGGVVKDILVKNGDKVKKGQILLKLDDLQAKANYTVTLKNRYELLAQVSRLSSILNGKKSIIFDKLLQSIEDKIYKTKLFKSQNAIFNAQKRLLLTQDAIIFKKIDSLKDEIKGTQESLISKSKYLKSLEEEISELTQLYKENIVSKINLREIQRKAYSLQSDLTNFKTTISKLEIRILELQEQSLLQKSEFLNKVVSQLDEARAKLSEIDEKLIATKDTVVKSILKASNGGVIQNLTTFTKGGVIQAGAPVMSIVPSEDSLIIQGRLNTTDIDQLTLGMKCDIMLVAFDTQNTFLVDGVVDYISPDSTIDKATNTPYYSIHISFTKIGLEQIIQNNFKLQTGMPTEAMIQTGSRTMLSYIIQPFKDITRRAFNED